MKGCHSFLPTSINSVKVHRKRTPTVLPCCSVTLRQESPCCPTLMESTQRPSVRQLVSCNVLWVERWVGVMSQKSSDRGDAMWRNLASISVCNRSPGDLQGAWNLMRYDRFLDQFMSSYLCVNSQVAAWDFFFLSALQSSSNTIYPATDELWEAPPLSNIWNICPCGYW